MEGFFFSLSLFDGKGDSTSGRGCTSGVQGAKAQPGERKLFHGGDGSGMGAGRETRRGRGPLKRFSKTDIWLQIPLHFLSPGKEVPYLLDNTQLK